MSARMIHFCRPGDSEVSPPARGTRCISPSARRPRKKRAIQCGRRFCEHLCGQGEGEEGGERGCAHGGEIAEAAGEAAVADGFGRMQVAAEVPVFEGEVGGDEDFGAGGGRRIAQSSPMPRVNVLLLAEKSRRICSIRASSPSVWAVLSSVRAGYMVATGGTFVVDTW